MLFHLALSGIDLIVTLKVPSIPPFSPLSCIGIIINIILNNYRVD